MKMVVTGQADLNKTVQELINEVARTGNRYLDLETGSFVSIVEETKPRKEEKCLPTKKA